MDAFYLMLIIMNLSSTLATDIAWNDKILNESISIFLSHNKAMDDTILKSLESKKTIFDSDAFKVLKLGSDLVPYLGKFLDVIETIHNLLSDDSEWSKKFLDFFKKEQQMADVNHQVFDIKKSMLKAKREMNNIHAMVGNETELSKLNATQIKNSEHYILSIRIFLNDMITSFGMHDTIFKSEPWIAMVGAPVLIESGLLIAAFEPFAGKIYPSMINNDKYSCRIRDIMLDYLPFVVATRLDQLDANFKTIMKVRNEPYNKTGYEKTPALPCNFHCKGCSICTSFYADDRRKGYRNDCLVDGWSKIQLIKRSNVLGCEVEYARHLRTLVEKMFPIELISEVCGLEPSDTTGNLLIPSRRKYLYLLWIKYCFSQVRDGQRSDSKVST